MYLQDDYITDTYECQVEKIIEKARVKKGYNAQVISFLEGRGDWKRAERIRECATYLGFTNIDNIAHIVKANFCRERLCSVCAWRRQARFVAQMRPVLQRLESDYQFIFATLTVQNVPLRDLRDTVDSMLIAYDKLLKHRKVRRSWCGKVRSLELSYNSDTDTFHPHIHMLIAVKPEYFELNGLYISQNELCYHWQECLQCDYIPVCDIRRVSDNMRGAVETLKYGLKPSKGETPLQAFADVLRGRRLVSFSGVFADVRRLLKLSSFEDVLTDDVLGGATRIEYILYKFDATGGVYNYYDRLYYEKE
jgi:plasmid rolling circle replication initiator protein Rep